MWKDDLPGYQLSPSYQGIGRFAVQYSLIKKGRVRRGAAGKNNPTPYGFSAINVPTGLVLIKGPINRLPLSDDNISSGY